MDKVFKSGGFTGIVKDQSPEVMFKPTHKLTVEDTSHYYSAPQDTESRLDSHIKTLEKGLEAAIKGEEYHHKQCESARDLINRGDADNINYESFDHHYKMCNKHRSDIKVLVLMIDSANRGKGV